MDTSANDIFFDEKFICNYCIEFSNNYLKIQSDNNKHKLEKFIEEVKKSSIHQEYDCILGLSGGLDSCWALVKAVELGLNPLVVHMDNGWNTELSQNNISNLVSILKVDLYTKVIDWDEYKSLMNSFFKANVVDVELLMDNAMYAVNFQQAKKNNLQFILTGSNSSTEGMKIPNSWNWYKYDKRNIFDINKKFENYRIKSFPSMSTIDYVRYHFINKIKWIPFLDYFDYNKNHASKILQEKFNFKPYPFKHGESMFTRFYQSYLLPKKFNIDKRRLHLSSLVISNQISRGDAEDLLSKEIYNQEDFNNDKNFFLKKMDWSDEDLKNYIKEKNIPHDFYKSEKFLWDNLTKIYTKFFFKNN